MILSCPVMSREHIEWWLVNHNASCRVLEVGRNSSVWYIYNTEFILSYSLEYNHFKHLHRFIYLFVSSLNMQNKSLDVLKDNWIVLGGPKILMLRVSGIAAHLHFLVFSPHWETMHGGFVCCYSPLMLQIRYMCLILDSAWCVSLSTPWIERLSASFMAHRQRPDFPLSN